MVGDVNIFLTDPTDPTLAELEIMIAGVVFDFNVEQCLCSSITNIKHSCILKSLLFKTFPVCDRAELQREGPRERGDTHDDALR